MKILSKLDSLDNIQDGNTRKLITKATSSGSGNAVTAVSVSGDTITYTKGSTFLTGHQSAFSNVKVGSSTVAADQAGDTLELVAGSNITLTPDTTNDKVTIAATVPTKTSDLTNDSGFITSDSDEKVKQTANTSSNSALRVLFAPNVLDTDYTGNVNKNSNFTYNPSTKALVTGGTVDGYKLAAASAKGVDTSIAAASTSTNLPTSQAVAGFVEGKGYTSNTGTITGITMNGASKGTSGVVDLGTVITAHQDISGKYDKSGGAITGAITRSLASSGTIATTNLFSVSGSTDGFKVDYAAATADKGVTTLYTTDDADAKISIGNTVSSTYKEAISVVNGSATINGYVPAAASAKSVDTSITAASTSANLPTSAAVATFVEGKGYTTNTGTITGVSINNTSIATSGVANIVTNTAYNSSTNKIATMADVPSFTFTNVIVNP